MKKGTDTTSSPITFSSLRIHMHSKIQSCQKKLVVLNAHCFLSSKFHIHVSRETSYKPYSNSTTINSYYPLRKIGHRWLQSTQKAKGDALILQSCYCNVEPGLQTVFIFENSTLLVVQLTWEKILSKTEIFHIMT